MSDAKVTGEPDVSVETPERRVAPRSDRWARRRHLALVALASFVGYICFRSGFVALRDRGPSGWALSLMLCLLAAASWTLAFSLVRSRRSRRDVEPRSSTASPAADATTTGATP